MVNRGCLDVDPKGDVLLVGPVAYHASDDLGGLTGEAGGTGEPVTGGIQSAAHIGAQEWSLGLGIEFDRVLISLVLNESTAPTLIDASGPTIFYFAEGLFFDLGPTSGKIEYVSDVAAIPLPAAGMLYLPLLAAGALALRRRKRG